MKDNGTGEGAPAAPATLTVGDLNGFSYEIPTLDHDVGDPSGTADEQAAATAETAKRVAERLALSNRNQITSFEISEPDAGTTGDPNVEDGDDTVELEAEVKGAFGAFENPFDQVDFYVSDAATDGTLYKVASVMASSASLEDDDAERVWTYTIEVSADDLYSVADLTDAEEGTGTGTRELYAFGVAEKGTVSLTSAAVTLVFEDR